LAHVEEDAGGRIVSALRRIVFANWRDGRIGKKNDVSFL
jgi:hypothetical protein